MPRYYGDDLVVDVFNGGGNCSSSSSSSSSSSVNLDKISVAVNTIDGCNHQIKHRHFCRFQRSCDPSLGYKLCCHSCCSIWEHCNTLCDTCHSTRKHLGNNTNAYMSNVAAFDRPSAPASAEESFELFVFVFVQIWQVNATIAGCSPSSQCHWGHFVLSVMHLGPCAHIFVFVVSSILVASTLMAIINVFLMLSLVLRALQA